MNKKGEPAPSLDLRDALPLSAAPERTQVEIPPLVGHYIDGTWVEGLESSRFDCVEPATGEVLTQVAAAGSEEVDQAVAAA
ncbi:MAG: betaine-aldehyde dehydrogenase, partial [Myxococcales bacterium]|nr:betaine-aldehyde dehydrogenase [Myxococcales bacterium]